MEKKLDEIIVLLRSLLEVSTNLYKTISKYDGEYLAEVEKDGYIKED